MNVRILTVVASVAMLAVQPLMALHSRVIKKADGWHMEVRQSQQDAWEEFVVKGISYTPAKRRESPDTQNLRDWMWVDDNGDNLNDFLESSFVDADFNNRQNGAEEPVGDGQLLSFSNIFRQYHHASDADAVQAGYGNDANQNLQYNHPTNRALLKWLYDTHGIQIFMGDFLGAHTIGAGVAWRPPGDQQQLVSYTSSLHKRRMLASVRQMAIEFKDDNWLAGYILGNENNLRETRTNADTNPRAYAQFLEEAAQAILEIDPNHIIIASLGDNTRILREMAQHTPSVQVIGMNTYRGTTLTDLPSQIKSIFTARSAAGEKPLLLTEFGERNPRVTQDVLDETKQLNEVRSVWEDVVRNMAGGPGEDNLIGGIYFEGVDNWWQNGRADIQNPGIANNEYRGLMSQGNGRLSPFLRQLRPIYHYFAEVWAEDQNEAPMVVVANPFQTISIVIGDLVIGTGDLTHIFAGGSYLSKVGDILWNSTFDWTENGEFGTEDLIALFQTGAYENPEEYEGNEKFDVNNSLATVVFDATGSSDPDGDALSFEWKDAQDRVRGTEALLELDLPVDDHIFQVTVTDPFGLSDRKDVFVKVTRSNPVVAVAAVAKKPQAGVKRAVAAFDVDAGPSQSVPFHGTAQLVGSVVHGDEPRLGKIQTLWIPTEDKVSLIHSPTSLDTKVSFKTGGDHTLTLMGWNDTSFSMDDVIVHVGAASGAGQGIFASDAVVDQVTGFVFSQIPTQHKSISCYVGPFGIRPTHHSGSQRPSHSHPSRLGYDRRPS